MADVQHNNSILIESRRLRDRLVDLPDVSLRRALRECEVSSPSLEGLLATEDAAELLFSFLSFKREREESGEEREQEQGSDNDSHRQEGEQESASNDSDDDLEREEREEEIAIDNDLHDGSEDGMVIFSYDEEEEGDGVTNIVWLSNHMFISNDRALHQRVDTSTRGYKMSLAFICSLGTPSGSSVVDDEDEEDEEPRECCKAHFYRMLPIAAAASYSSALPVYTEEELVAVDTLLRLLAKHKTAVYIRFLDMNYVQYSVETQDFSASLLALKDFVGQAASPRTLQFDVSLSPHQWRAIVGNCHSKNVELAFSDWEDGGMALIEAVTLNRGPAKLQLSRLSRAPEEAFHAFVAALGDDKENNSTSSLLELTLTDLGFISVLLDGLSRNRGLHRLIFRCRTEFSDEQWEMLWRDVVAPHPTLRAIRVGSGERSRSEWRDKVLIRSIQSSAALWCLELRPEAIHNVQLVEKELRPILEFNYFRPIVRAIKQEPNPTLRGHLFAATLQSCEDIASRRNSSRRDHPSWYYWLLRENPDLLEQYSRPKDVLLKQWDLTMRRLHSLEERMRVCEMEIPARLQVAAPPTTTVENSKRKRLSSGDGSSS